MKMIVTTAIVWLCCTISLTSQTTTSIKGTIVEASSEKPLKGVLVKIKNTSISFKTTNNGQFFIEKIPIGNQVLELRFESFESQNLPITILKNTHIDLGIIFLYPSIPEINETSVISLSDDDLLDDGDRSSDYIAGLFQSSKDTYLKAAAFNFGQAWYKVRGYDSSYGTISINGIEMNKLFDGRPQWTNLKIVNNMIIK